MSKPVIKRTYVHWRGSFVAIGGTVWEVEILRPEKVLTPVELDFPADEPLIIEWDDITPESTVTGSTATLKVISATDREFIDLYARQPGEVRLAVWRRNPGDTRTLYWQGSLDPEFYEEPYETLQGYDVTLTFSDFGYMDRIDFDLRGLLTYDTLLKHCLEQAGFDADFAPMKIGEGISTKRTPEAEEPLTLADLAVDARNFYDEEGKPQTLRQVAEGLLQPMALHMVQTGGAVWVYDDNWLATRPRDGVPSRVRWDGDEQTLSAAETYNNVKVSFSGYADGDLGLPQFELRGKTGKGAYNPWPTFNSTLPGGGASADDYGLYFTFSYNNHLRKSGENWFDLDTAYRSFTVMLRDAVGVGGRPLLKGLTLHQTTADPQGAADGLYDGSEWDTDLYGGTAVSDKWPKAFRIEPYHDGAETEGVAVSITTGGKITDTYGKQRPDAAFYDTTETETALDPTPRLFGQTVRYGLDCAEIWYAAGDLYREWTADLGSGATDFSYFDYTMRYVRNPWTVGSGGDAKTLTPSAADLRVLTTEPVYLPPVDAPSDYYVNFKVEMLLSALYNPFSGADNDNENTNNNDIKIRSRWVFVPFTAVIRDKDGHITHYYSNLGTLSMGRTGYFMRPDVRPAPEERWYPAGEYPYHKITDTSNLILDYDYPWQWGLSSEGIADVTDSCAYFGQAWLAWYEADEDGETSAIAAGFKANRHCIGRGDLLLGTEGMASATPKTVFSRSFKKMPEGQFLPYPPQGGWLEVTLYRTVLPMDDRGSEHDAPGIFSPLTYLSPQEWLERKLEGKGPDNGGRRGMFNSIRWHLFKAPEIEVVRADGSFDTAEADDAEYSGYLDRDAREELSIDTVVGTLPDGGDCPSAKGLLRFADNGKPVRLLTRGGVTACPEKLLIGSLYSQYSQRRTVLSGVARLQPQWYGPHLLRDAAQDDWHARLGTPAPRFRISGQTVDLRLGQAELTLTEIRPDSYEPADIEEVDE